MTYSERFQTRAAAKITQYGRPMTVEHNTDDAYNVATGNVTPVTTTFNANGVPLPYSSNQYLIEQANQETLTTGFQIFLEGGKGVPTVGDRIYYTNDNTQIFRIMAMTVYAPQDVDIMYILDVKK